MESVYKTYYNLYCAECDEESCKKYIHDSDDLTMKQQQTIFQCAELRHIIKVIHE